MGRDCTLINEEGFSGNRVLFRFSAVVGCGETLWSTNYGRSELRVPYNTTTCEWLDGLSALCGASDTSAQIV